MLPIKGPLTDIQLRASAVPVVDEYSTFEAQHLTLNPSTDTTITLVNNARIIKVKNWDSVNRLLVKATAISSDTDSTADRIGKAPAADVPNEDWYSGGTTIHLRSAGASEVTVLGFR